MARGYRWSDEQRDRFIRDWNANLGPDALRAKYPGADIYRRARDFRLAGFPVMRRKPGRRPLGD